MDTGRWRRWKLDCLWILDVKTLGSTVNPFQANVPFLFNQLKISKTRGFQRFSDDMEWTSTWNEFIWSSVSVKVHTMRYFLQHFFFFIFSQYVLEQMKWFIWIRTLRLLTKKLDLENSIHQSFATIPKFLTFRYIYATSEQRGHRRNFALSKIYKIYFRSFREAGNY